MAISNRIDITRNVGTGISSDAIRCNATLLDRTRTQCDFTLSSSVPHGIFSFSYNLEDCSVLKFVYNAVYTFVGCFSYRYLPNIFRNLEKLKMLYELNGLKIAIFHISHIHNTQENYCMYRFCAYRNRDATDVAA